MMILLLFMCVDLVIVVCLIVEGFVMCFCIVNKGAIVVGNDVDFVFVDLDVCDELRVYDLCYCYKLLLFFGMLFLCVVRMLLCGVEFGYGRLLRL